MVSIRGALVERAPECVKSDDRTLTMGGPSRTTWGRPSDLSFSRITKSAMNWEIGSRFVSYYSMATFHRKFTSTVPVNKTQLKESSSLCEVREGRRKCLERISKSAPGAPDSGVRSIDFKTD